MKLTGVPLILLTATATLATGAATAWLWPRGGRLRPVTRTGTVLLLETLVVLTAGLVVNRHEQFYPSWPALRGDTGTVAVTETLTAGRLDDRVRSAQFSWQPPGSAAWQLTRPPVVTLPLDYRERPGVRFPVVLAFATPVDHRIEAVTVSLVPGPHTTAATLGRLPTALSHDLRVAGSGWDVIGDSPLAAAFVAATPAGFARLNEPVTALPPALAAPLRLPSASPS